MRKCGQKNVKRSAKNKSKCNSNYNKYEYIKLIDAKTQMLRLAFNVMIVRQENQMTVSPWKHRRYDSCQVIVITVLFSVSSYFFRIKATWNILESEADILRFYFPVNDLFQQ